MGKLRDITGQKFNMLTAIRFARKDKRKKAIWLFCCDCGNEKEIDLNTVTQLKVKSCGCTKKTNCNGVSHTEVYYAYYGMMRRCYNKKYKAYDDYGGRGIFVCDEWKNDFMAFYNWSINNGWQKGLTIDRRNNNFGYYPKNCRWVTQKIQANNQRRTVYITHNKITLSIYEWTLKTGLSRKTIDSRIRAGWDSYDILYKPVIKRK